MSVDYSRIARDVAFTLEVKSPKIFENIFLSNGVLALMGMNSRVKIVRGGNRFDERIRLGQNTNVDHRSKFGTITTKMQNNVQTAFYGHAVCSGAAVVNLVEEDQNAGAYRISNLADDAVNELKMTFPNVVGAALMKATSGADDPTSIIEELQAVAYGSQTRTTGAIARSSFPGTAAKQYTDAYQTQYDTTTADISGATGLAVLEKFLLTCSPGGSAITEQPDIMLTRNGVIARLSGNLDVLRRWTANDKLASIGFDNMRVMNCALLADATLQAGSYSGYGYVINTNYAQIQVLGGSNTKEVGNVKVIGNGKVSVPIQIRPAIESASELQYSIKAYMVYNLTFGGLRQHGLKTGLTES